MALMKQRISCFMPRFIRLIAFAPTTLSLSHLSTLAHNNITHLGSPFADFATTKFNLSSADIAHMLKHAPSLDNTKTLQNVERFANILTKYGCTQHQIARFMRSQPKILTVNAEKLLELKIELLKDLGIEQKDLPEVLLKAPRFLGANLQESLQPKITFLKSIFQSQELLLKALKISPNILIYNLERKLRPSLALWEGCGFQGEELARFLSSRPRLLVNPSLTPSKIDLIRKMGICKESKMYKHVLSVVVPARMETLESKMDSFREWGLSAEEIWELFRTSPSVFAISNDNRQKKMDFVVNTMKLPPNSVVKHSAYLLYSLENVIKPRFAVLQHMKSLNGVEHLKSKELYSFLPMSEANFINKILKGHPELETLYALHKKAIPNV